MRNLLLKSNYILANLHAAFMLIITINDELLCIFFNYYCGQKYRLAL